LLKFVGDTSKALASFAKISSEGNRLPSSMSERKGEEMSILFVVGTWASVDLAAAIRKLASVALKARRQNELLFNRDAYDFALTKHRSVISRTVKPYRAPREHYAFIADCIHR
jgi:hypothetical protein